MHYQRMRRWPGVLLCPLVKGGEDVVDGGRRLLLQQDGTQRLDVLVADFGPVDHEAAGGEATGENLGAGPSTPPGASAGVSNSTAPSA